MATTLSAIVRAHVQTTEVVSDGDLGAATTLLHNGYDNSPEYSSTTSPDMTKAAYQTVTMTAGAATIDMTSLLRQAAVITFSGLNLRAIHLFAPSTNSGTTTVAKGASNGLTALGAAFSVALKPGMGVLIYFTVDNAAAVGGSDKTLDLSGTGTDAVELSAIAGT